MAVVALSLLSSVCLCPRSWATNEKILDPVALATLESKADQAQPQERSFLYAELVNQMTDLAGRQFGAGDSVHASATLKLVRQYAEKVRAGLLANSKKVKNAELLMQQTCFRLNDILHSVSYEDRPPLETTLKQVDQIQTELMMQLFKH